MDQCGHTRVHQSPKKFPDPGCFLNVQTAICYCFFVGYRNVYSKQTKLSRYGYLNVQEALCSYLWVQVVSGLFSTSNQIVRLGLDSQSNQFKSIKCKPTELSKTRNIYEALPGYLPSNLLWKNFPA